MSAEAEAELARMGASEFATLPDLVRLHARCAPSRVAVIDGERVLDWGTFDERIDRTAAALQRDGCAKGQAIAICAANSADYLVVFLGALRAGLAVVPLPPSATAETLALMVADSGSRMLFHDGSVSDLADRLADRPGLRCVDLRSGFEPWLMPPGTRPSAVAIAPEDPFNIIYSSGTTGAPKGIVQPHSMRWRHAIPGNPPGYGPQAVTLLSTGLYSNTTLVSAIPALAGGGTLVLMHKFDAGEFLRLSEAHRVTHAMLVPVQYRRILAHPDFGRYDLSSYVMKFCTSAPLPAETKRRILHGWPGGFVEFYGMTEGGGSTCLLAHEFPDKLHTVGRPLPGHEFRIIDDEGREAAPGSKGEIVGTSPAMMSGYHALPERTSEAEWIAPDGRRFIRTGDIGRFDEDGFLILMDRKKDVIISGGFNIYPSDLEAVLLQHPAVADAAVVGAPSEQWGETPVAFVVSKGASADEILDFANVRLGKTQRISAVRIVTELPRNHLGKVMKRDLRP